MREGEGLTALIRSKMKLNLSSIIQNVQPDCLQTGESSAVRTKLLIRFQKTKNHWVLIHWYALLLSNMFCHSFHVFPFFLTNPSRSLIHFFLPDNPAEFTCSKNVRTQSSHPKCFGQKLGDTARWQRKSDVFTPNKQRSQKRGVKWGWVGTWGWAQMALI